MYYKIIFLFFVLLYSLPQANGQQLFLKHFTVDEGLPSNEIYQILQDSTGQLLIATDRGAVRYDGYSFVDIPLENRLTSKPVYYIYKTPEGRVYFSGLQGNVYQYQNDTLFAYPFNDRTARLFNHPGILIANSISSQNDTLWISFNNDYNYNYKVGSCFVTKQGNVTEIKKSDGIYFDLQHSFYYRQLSQSSAGKTEQAVNIVWPNGSVTKDDVALAWRGGYIRRLFYGKCGDYDLFSIGRQLFVYKDQHKIGSYLFPENVLCLTVTDNQRFYIGFENKGAGLYQLQNGLVTGPAETILEGYSVTCVYKDSQNGLWFSTMENGLFYNHPSQTRYWENGSKIVAIQKRNEKVFIGHYNGLIQVFSNGRPMPDLQLPLEAGNFLMRLSFDYKDSLIAITDKGYYTQRGEGWQLRPGQDILLLSAGPELVYGASAPMAALHVYEGLGGDLVQKKLLPKRIISMFANSQKGLWIGTWEGLLKYEQDKLVDFSHVSPVFKDRIIAINELPGRHLVVASLGNGIAVYKNNRIHTLTVSNGLPSQIINSMTINKDTIWIGTNKGLSMALFEKDRFRVVHLGLEAGLPSQDIQQFSVSNGWLYIKWVNSLVVLKIDDLLTTDRKSRTYITSVLVNDKRGTYRNNGTYGYQQNTLTFHFTSVNLSAAYQQEYAYLLEGFDKSWQHTRERYVKYTNLPPGKYRFKVQAINLQDNTATALTGYAFAIRPALWQQWWFPFVIVSLLVVLLLFIFQRRLNAIKEKNSLMLELAENRQKVLVQLIHPHFVFNVLNTIQGAVLKQDKLVAASLIAKFAKLMRLSMELSKEKWVNLAKETDLLTKYFELEEIRSPGRFSYRIETVPPLRPEQVSIPSMLIQPFVENAIKHGVMHLADKKGCIQIKFWMEGTELLCIVDDNGIGRQQSERINKNKREQHDSSGIDITINRLRLLHREQDTPFRYEVIDKQDSSGQPEGTMIKFSIPFKNVYESHPSHNHR